MRIFQRAKERWQAAKLSGRLQTAGEWCLCLQHWKEVLRPNIYEMFTTHLALLRILYAWFYGIPTQFYEIGVIVITPTLWMRKQTQRHQRMRQKAKAHKHQSWHPTQVSAPKPRLPLVPLHCVLIADGARQRVRQLKIQCADPDK